jgi:Protein of unknown function (DUF3224)
MMTTLNGSFEVTSWVETTYRERDGRRLTRASVSQRLAGDVAGEGSVEWLMSYDQDATARFVGLQLLDGEIAGRPGTFVLETHGDFDGKVARWEATVVPGSGTGDLRELSGHGKFEAPLGSTATFSLDVNLADQPQ